MEVAKASLPRDKDNNVYAPPPFSRRHLGLVPDLSVLLELVWNNRPLNESPHARQLHQRWKEPQAVASSVAIARGGSYLVTRKTIPQATRRNWSQPRSSDEGDIQRQLTISAKKSYSIVYKIAQLQFDIDGKPIPEHRSRFASILLDLFVLTHAPIIDHDGIVNLLGLAWASNGYPGQDRLPVPILEYADFGNLADLQKKELLDPADKGRIILDVASAIDFLHRCEITYGDVKAENILIFSDRNTKFKAKVSDFGTSVLGFGGGGEGYFSFLPTGTKIWAAPELSGASLSQTEVQLTDVWSFGLLAWKIGLEGFDPLARVFLHGAKAPTLNSFDGDELKRCNEDELSAHIKADLLASRAKKQFWAPILIRLMGSDKVSPKLSRGYAQRVIKNYSKFIEFNGILESILFRTLKLVPTERDLGSAVKHLQEHYGIRK